MIKFYSYLALSLLLMSCGSKEKGDKDTSTTPQVLPLVQPYGQSFWDISREQRCQGLKTFTQTFFETYVEQVNLVKTECDLLLGHYRAKQVFSSNEKEYYVVFHEGGPEMNFPGPALCQEACETLETSEQEIDPDLSKFPATLEAFTSAEQKIDQIYGLDMSEYLAEFSKQMGSLTINYTDSISIQFKSFDSEELAGKAVVSVDGDVKVGFLGCSDASCFADLGDLVFSVKYLTGELVIETPRQDASDSPGKSYHGVTTFLPKLEVDEEPAKIVSPEDPEYFFSEQRYRKAEDLLRNVGCSFSHPQGLVNCPVPDSKEKADDIFEALQQFHLSVLNDSGIARDVDTKNRLDKQFRIAFSSLKADPHYKALIAEHAQLLSETNKIYGGVVVNSVVSVKFGNRIRALEALKSGYSEEISAELERLGVNSILIYSHFSYQESTSGGYYVYFDYKQQVADLVSYLKQK